MPMRRRAPLRKTYLCAVKFWRTNPSIPTLASGVRHVVREQGYSSQKIYKAENEMHKDGLIRMSPGRTRTVALTPHGENLARCRRVKLAPWTNDPYPGSALEGTPRMTAAQSRKRIAQLRKQGCKVTRKNVPGVGTVVLKECPKRRR